MHRDLEEGQGSTFSFDEFLDDRGKKDKTQSYPQQKHTELIFYPRKVAVIECCNNRSNGKDAGQGVHFFRSIQFPMSLIHLSFDLELNRWSSITVILENARPSFLLYQTMNETWTNVTKKAKKKIDKALIEITPASSSTQIPKKERGSTATERHNSSSRM